MNKHFTYSILQYFPNEGSGEVLNIGILLLYPDLNFSQFIYPQHLTRLKHAFPGFSDKVVKGFVRSIEQKSLALSQSPEIWASIDLENDTNTFISEHLLLPDASPLRFSPTKPAVRYAEPERIAADYKRLFLSSYETHSPISRKDESSLVRQFKKYIMGVDERVWEYVREKFELETETRSYQFDFAWKNGSHNLVKAISLDLKRPDAIQRKAERYFGRFSLLKSSAETQNLHFDLLLARPKPRSLWRAYDQSIDILAQAPYTKIWEGKEINQYSKQTAEYLLELL